jgi:hypothetical protein
MDLSPFVLRFTLNAERIRALASGASPEEARWKPSETAWSLLEVMGHLLDEEREDFRRRLDYLLHRPGETWPPIDPEGWVTARGYNLRDPQATLDAFLEERRGSITWLRSLPAAQEWDRVYPDSRFRGIRAGDLLASWLAHDYLHMRQMVRIHFLHGEALSRPYATFYAGSW